MSAYPRTAASRYRTHGPTGVQRAPTPGKSPEQTRPQDPSPLGRQSALSPGRIEDWPEAAGSAVPQPGEVHVWRVRVPAYGCEPVGWHALLDVEERRRLDRKHCRGSYQRELTARATLRLLLGSYLKCPPQSIRLARLAAGKPVLDSRRRTGPLEFNLSHAGDWVLLAFASGVRVGIDVEEWRTMEYDEIVRRYFAPAELEAWGLVPREDEQEAFFAAWTRKEAYLKATGLGLTQPLESFAVRYTPRDAPAELLWCAESPQEPQRWTLAALPPERGYAAALAVEATTVHLIRRTWRADDSCG